MTSAKPTGPSPTVDALLRDTLPLIDTVYVAGPPVLLAWTGTILFALLLAGPFALLATLVLAFAAATALVGLVGAILASPYLLVRHLRARRVAPATERASRRLASAQPQPMAA
jgi:hypothetical protein